MNENKQTNFVATDLLNRKVSAYIVTETGGATEVWHIVTGLIRVVLLAERGLQFFVEATSERRDRNQTRYPFKKGDLVEVREEGWGNLRISFSDHPAED